MLADTLRHVVDGGSLDADAAEAAMREIISGSAPLATVAAFLVAMRMKGESVAELTGCARAMRAAAVPVSPSRRPLLDTCGTGGDGAHSINVSTLAAMVCAAAGARVAKHGNRSVSSRCGSADLMEALGVSIDLDAPAVARCIDEVGVGFMFAPRFHPAMRHVAALRRELGIRTLFNLLGPLANPASVEHHVMGVYAAHLCEPMARVLAGLGVRSALVVHGAGGLDEVAVSGPTEAAWLRDGEIVRLVIDPESLGIRGGSLQGGGPEENARVAAEVLAGRPGPARDAVALNAAAGLLASGLVDDLREGLARATEALDDGRARDRLEALVSLSRSLVGDGS